MSKKKWKWTPTKIIVTVLIIIVIGILAYFGLSDFSDKFLSVSDAGSSAIESVSQGGGGLG